MNQDLTPKAVDALRTQYVEAAAAHGRATHDGDSRVANEAWRVIVDTAAALLRYGPRGEDALRSLTEDGDTAVRVWAATETLFFDAPI
ncbi:MAG: hypothetical protein M3081_04645, partial [Gemmatimonadota bacterium]|nr:hypothetical protein [Gemmatimonadota bacterium]